MIKVIDNEYMKFLIDHKLIDNQNTKIKNFDQIEKYFYKNSPIFWYGLFDDLNKLRACAGCIKEENNVLFVAEFESFKSEFGSILLHYLLNLNYSYIYLLSNPEYNEAGLLNYYRRPEFELNEYIFNEKFHYFYSGKKKIDLMKCNLIYFLK